MTDSAGFSDQTRRVAANFEMLAAGADRFGEQRGLGISTLAFHY